MADKYKSLKVKELQEILQKNGLPHTGKKEDLIDRLVKNDEKKALELSSFDDLAGLEEFEESKLEDLDSLTDLKSTATTTTEKKQDDTLVDTTTEAIDKEASSSEPTKNTTASTTITSTEEEKKTEPPAEVTKPGSDFKYTPITFGSPKTTNTTSKPIELSSTTKTTDSELERKIERAKRFNVDLDEKTKQQLRADRFGASAPKKIKNPAPVKQQQQQQPAIDPEILKKRAERFGIPSKEVEEERKRKRAERFGIPTKEAEEEKKRRRAERFNTSK
ncbi:hypothetical protein BDC45DRAFT_608591 [Circinella umbellata]|nr:hypothetical protein BDC45DRAFT_608591 [Circinella umbellata]